MENNNVLYKQLDNETDERYLFWCPGCNCAHWFSVRGQLIWQWNGDMIKPTVNPSIRVIGIDTCHSFIKDGNIQFLGDCTHKLKNQTVPIPVFNTAQDDIETIYNLNK